jgi:hypothetical protein
VALVAVLVVVADPRSWLRYLRSPSFETFYALRLDALLATNFRMALTLGAVVWYGASPIHPCSPGIVETRMLTYVLQASASLMANSLETCP